jgi:5-formyltetrahydrofolate cyclo-ligase
VELVAQALKASDPAALRGELRRELRRKARAARAALPFEERRHAEQAIACHLAAHLRGTGLLSPRTRIAGYLAVRSEIGVADFLAHAMAAQCSVFLPRVTAARLGRMTFSPATATRRRGAFGIPEPDSRERIDARWLQIVLLPLVGFDDEGNRLGSGAGFYDRALAFRAWRDHWRGPRLIGVAHSCQRTAALPTLPTDIPLDAVVTEKGFFPLSGATR